VVVVDTNVVAYLLMVGDRTGQAQVLLARDPDWRSDAFLLVEFCNVLATYVRSRALARSQAQALIAQAEQRITTLASVPHAQVLLAAADYSVSAYDARFLVAAQSMRTRLITEDAKLRSAAPALTQSIEQALAE